MRYTYRSRLPSRGSSIRGANYIVLGGSRSGRLTASTQQQQFALWVKAQHDQLTALKDQEALRNLANGATDTFIDYAKTRVGQAGDPTERSYWQDLLTRAQQKVEDDALSADVAAGRASLEKLRDHLQSRADGLSGGRDNPNYPDLVKQIADVQDSIKARDFRNEMLTAQQNYMENPDRTGAKQDYAAKLEELLGRTTDGTAQDAIMNQLKQVQSAIVQDRVLSQERDLSVHLIDYRDGKASAADTMNYLHTLAAQAASPGEAQRYASAAAAIQTLETQKQRAAQAAARRSGSGAAIKDALFAPRQNYLDSLSTLKRQLSGGGVPSLAAFRTFSGMADAYDKALRGAASMATTDSQLQTILDTGRSIADAYSSHLSQAGDNVAARARRQVTNLATTVADAGKSGLDPGAKADRISAARHLAMQALMKAQNDPILRAADSLPGTDAASRRSSDIGNELSKISDQQDAYIAQVSGILAGDTPTKGSAKYTALYDTYAKAGGTADETAWLAHVRDLEGMGSAAADAFRKQQAAKLQLTVGDPAAKNPDGSDMTQLQITQLKELVRADLSTLNAAQEHSQEISQQAAALAALTAFRGEDGSTVAGPSNPYALGGALDESTRAAAMRDSVAPTSDVSASAPPSGEPRDVAPVDVGPAGGPALGRTDMSSFLPSDPITQLLEAHVSAQDSLDQGGTSVPLPQWELPNLPPEAAFSSGSSGDGSAPPLGASAGGTGAPPPMSPMPMAPPPLGGGPS